MEYFGVFAFVFVLGLFSSVESLKKRMNNLERGTETKNGGIGEMSRLIEELKGKWCIMDCDELDEEKVQVCDVDGEWVKVMYKVAATKKEPEKSIYKLIRTTSIDNVEILEEM